VDFGDRFREEVFSLKETISGGLQAFVVRSLGFCSSYGLRFLFEGGGRAVFLVENEIGDEANDKSRDSGENRDERGFLLFVFRRCRWDGRGWSIGMISAGG